MANNGFEETGKFYEDQSSTPLYDEKFLVNFSNLMIVSFVLWIMLVVYQFLVGLPLLLVGYGLSMLICGVWNLINCIKWFKFMSIIRKYPTYENAVATYNSFSGQIVSTWIFFGLNLVLGGGLGAIGCAYDLFLCYYAKANAEKLGVRK